MSRSTSHRVPDARRPEVLAELTVADVMRQSKGRVSDEATLWDALERFLTYHTRHLVVVDRERRFQGVLTDRHLLTFGLLDEARLRRVRVSDVPCLTWPVLEPGTSLTGAAQRLTECEADAAPVLDEHERVLGVITRADVVAALADHGPPA